MIDLSEASDAAIVGEIYRREIDGLSRRCFNPHPPN